MQGRLFAVLLGVGLVTLSASVYLRAVSPTPAVALRALAGTAIFVAFGLIRAGPARHILRHLPQSAPENRWLTLDDIDVANVGDNPAVWEKVVQKLHGKLMPPAAVRGRTTPRIRAS